MGNMHCVYHMYNVHIYVDAPCTLFVVAIFGASTRMNDMAKKHFTNGRVIF